MRAALEASADIQVAFVFGSLARGEENPASDLDIAAHLITDSEASPPTTMAAGFAALRSLGILPEELAQRLQKAVGCRNISVRSYREIDGEIVYAIITTRLDDFSDFASRVDALLRSADN